MPEKLSFGDMEDGEDLATTVLTCEGDLTDPAFPLKLELLVTKLQHLISDEKKPLHVTKVEPWNSVRVTFDIPQEAAQRLRQLAERGDRVLRELGILSVQIEGDQVITLTLAGQFNEPHEIILRKSSENRNDVTSVSYNLPSSEPVAGPSNETTHKNISQFLGNIVGGAAAAAATAAPPARVEKPEITIKQEPQIGFRSPNVVAPSSSEPIPFLLPNVVSTSAATGTFPSSLPNVSSKSHTAPFPFASMTHAMNTKHVSSSSQYIANVTGSNPHPTTLLSSTSIAMPVTRPKTTSSPVFNNTIISRVTSPNLVTVPGRANVALSSPLLVNLLQSETSNLQGHTKLMPPPMIIANSLPKRKRKPRKPKDNKTPDGIDSMNSSTSPSPTPHASIRSANAADSPTSIGQTFSLPLGNISVSSPNSQISNLHSIIKSHQSVSAIQAHTASIHPQAQGQPGVSIQVCSQGLNQSRKVQGQVISPIHCQPQSVPNIHPQAQGQPQVHTGNLPLHSHIPVVSSQLARPHTSIVQSYALSRTVATAASISRMVLTSKDISSATKMPDTPSKVMMSTKTSEQCIAALPCNSESNPFPSPPSSGNGKTKHLINPFTGQLEPMPSDDEEEDESIGSLPPFPDFEIETSENGQSERSLSDGGKENYHSSDTDSGISKSHTDISQSSTECGPVQVSRELKNQEAMTNVEKISTAAVTSSIPGEKLKLRLKLDPKALRESKELESKEKKMKECNPQVNQKIDVALVNIPGLKKGIALGSAAPEPRVPPLHISLRGPNAAVVVSPKKDDMKSRHAGIKEECFSSETTKVPQKKARSPRSTRTPESSFSAMCASSRMPETSPDKRNKGSTGKDCKRTREDIWSQNAKTMSGGGIVEVSDKNSSSFVSVVPSVLQRKSSFSSHEHCKSDVITLTSCATGESVSIHTAASVRSPLPFHLVMSPERENANSVTNQHTPSANSKSNVQVNDANYPDKDTKSVLSNDNLNEAQENLFDSSKISLASRTENPSEHNPLVMQTNQLPHTLSGRADNARNSVQEAAFQSDFNPQVSTNCVPTNSVPLSPHSAGLAATPNYADNETPSTVASVDSQVNTSTDANTQVSKERDWTVAPSGTGSTTATSTTDKVNNQCNIISVNSAYKVSENASVVLTNSVQNELVNQASSEIPPVANIDENEVQNSAVNKEQTANNVDTHVNDVSYVNNNNKVIENNVVNSVTLPVEKHDQCKNTVISGFVDVCKPPLASIVSVAKREIIKDVLDSPDKGLCVIELKKPPIAQIITVDNLPIQSHVIEVPSLSASLAMQRSLATSNLAIEVSSIPSLIPSYGGAFLPARNTTLMVQKAKAGLSCDGGRDSLGFGETRTNSSCPDCFSNADKTSNDDSPSKSTTNENESKSLSKEEDTMDQSSSTPASEESSMDSIDEERKKCMLAAEVKTSTPGPPVDTKDGISTCAAQSVIVIGHENDEKLTTATVSTGLPDLNTQPKEEVSQVLVPPIENHLPNNEEIPLSKDNEEESVSEPKKSSEHTKSAGKIDCLGKVDLTNSTLLLNHCLTPCDPMNSSTSSDHTKISPFPSSDHVPSNMKSPHADILKNAHPSNVLLPQSSEASASVENDQRPKTMPVTEAISVVCSTSNPVVTSLLSHGRFLSPEVSASGRVRLIFKGSTQHSMLTNCNSQGGVVLPLNAAKTVPIKLVTLPAGAAGLSVRSTSNPKLVEIIGSKSQAHPSPLSSGHPPSPVRLVVSKVSTSTTASGSNQSSGSSLRNRVVVKSVMVTSSSPSLKLVSSAKANAPYNSAVVTPISSSPDVIVEKKISVSTAVTDCDPVTSQTSATKYVPMESNLSSSICISSNSEDLNIVHQDKVQTHDNNPTISAVTSAIPNVECHLQKQVSTSVTANPPDTNASLLKLNDDNITPIGLGIKETVPQKEDALPVIKLNVDIADNYPNTNTQHISICGSRNNPDLPDFDGTTHVIKCEEVLANEETVHGNDDLGTEKQQSQLDQAPETNPSEYSELDYKPCLVTEVVEVASTMQTTIDTGNETKIFEVPSTSGTSEKCNTEHCDEFLSDQTFLFSDVQNEICVNPEVVIKCEDIVHSSNRVKVVDPIRPSEKKPKIEENKVACGIESNQVSEESQPSKMETKSQNLPSLVQMKKTVKRKCSENAAELIKACMGVDDNPKRVLPPPKVKVSDEVVDKPDPEETVRTSMRLRRDDIAKKSKSSMNSDCSSEDEHVVVEACNKARVRERSTRSKVCNRDNLTDQVICRAGRQRSGSNESQKSEDSKIKTRDSKRETRKEEPIKKVPERSKRGTLKVQGVQRNMHVKDNELKTGIVNAREEVNVKRKTRSTGNTEIVEPVPAKRRRYSKDGHR